MGRSVTGPEYYEYRVTDYLQAVFERFGIPWQRQLIQPLRENILARLEGDVPPERGGPLLLFDAHQDTVPVDGMTIPPWTPTIRDGRLYGRGSCDIKGGMTAMLGALVRLAEERPRGMPTVVMACTVNEEHGFSGARALSRLWTEPDGGFLPRRPDAVVVAEPTQLNVAVAHKGMVRWRAHTRGRAAHSSRPEAGDNAIYKMSRVLDALAAYQRDIVGQLAEHPLCGRPTLNVGTIHGGLSVNTVPAECTIEIDRRIVPGEDPATAHRQVGEYLAKTLGPDLVVEHEPPFMQSPGLSDANSAQLAERMSAAAREVAGRGERIGVAFGTNAAIIAAGGMPAVVFGPGDIAQAHTADEWLPLDELAPASEAYYRFARNWAND
jgi:acetylornithine deacetylase